MQALLYRQPLPSAFVIGGMELYEWCGPWAELVVPRVIMHMDKRIIDWECEDFCTSWRRFNLIITVVSSCIVLFEIARDGHDVGGGFSRTRSNQFCYLVSKWAIKLDEQNASFSGKQGRILTKTNNIDYMTYSCVVCYITVSYFIPFKKKYSARHCDSVMLPLPKNRTNLCKAKSNPQNV